MSATSARDDILARSRRALAGSAAAEPWQRQYQMAGALPPGSAGLVALLTDRLLDYKATVHAAIDSEVASTIAGIVVAHAGDSARLVVADDLPERYRTGWTAVVDQQFAPQELDSFDGAVTTCAVAIAETGTLILDAGVGQGRRAITLVPDLHVCIVRHDQIVHSVPEAIALSDPTRPLTMISGPSATSDIELQRVEGVHGPRTLHVLIVG